MFQISFKVVINNSLLFYRFIFLLFNILNKIPPFCEFQMNFFWKNIEEIIFQL